LGQRIHIGPAVLRLRRPGMADAVSDELEGGLDAWSSPVVSRRRMWRVALVAGAAGFLLAALLALCVVRLQPSTSARASESPAAQTR
jgi:hypothetical protein